MRQTLTICYTLLAQLLQHCDAAKEMAPYSAENEFVNIKSGVVTGYNILLHDSMNKC